MKRRRFISIFGAAASAAWLGRAGAQRSSDAPLIGFLDGKKRLSGEGLISAFHDGLRELGYDEGRNIHIVYRFADGRDDRLIPLAKELVARKPQVIVAPGVNAAVAAKTVTATTPIVSWALADAVHLGLVASYSHPRGNVTGIEPYVDGLPAKQLQRARELSPNATKIGLLGNLNDPKAPPQRAELEQAARALKIEVVVPELRGPEGLEAAMRGLARERVDVVVVLQTALTLSERQQIGALAITNRLLTVFGYRENVEDGGLVSYGVDLRWCSRRAATYVHKILRGSPPGDLPIEFPTKLELVVNLKTARALGVTIAQALLLQADEVIQ